MLMRILRMLAALSLLAMGAVHLQQYIGESYSSIPTIGVLFLLNAIGGALVALGLLFPVGAFVRGRAGELVTGLLAVAGATMALASLVALSVSENATLFGFHEQRSGGPITAAIVSEAIALIACASLSTLCFLRPRARAGTSTPAAMWGSRSSVGRT